MLTGTEDSLNKCTYPNKDFKCINCDTIFLDELILFCNINIHFGVQFVMKTLGWMIQKKSPKKPEEKVLHYENKTLIVNFQKLFLLWNSSYLCYIYLLLKENFAYLSYAIKHH